MCILCYATCIVIYLLKHTLLTNHFDPRDGPEVMRIRLLDEWKLVRNDTQNIFAGSKFRDDTQNGHHFHKNGTRIQIQQRTREEIVLHLRHHIEYQGSFERNVNIFSL